jgi:hypothetical protein
MKPIYVSTRTAAVAFTLFGCAAIGSAQLTVTTNYPQPVVFQAQGGGQTAQPLDVNLAVTGSVANFKVSWDQPWVVVYWKENNGGQVQNGQTPVLPHQVGQADPPLQAAVVSSQGTPLPFSVSASTPTGGSWLLAARSGATPGTVIAGISPNLLTPGTYSGSVNIQPTDPTLVPLQAPVILNVASGPVFMPSTNQLTFQSRIGGPIPAAQQITIGASGGGTIVYYPSAKTADDGSWLKVSPSVGVTPSDVTVTIDAAGLSAGLYYGVVVLNDTATVSPVAYVPVTLQVSSGPILSVAGQPLMFSAQAGGAPAAAQQITVGGNGNSVALHVDNTASWLQVIPSDGSTDAVLSVIASPTMPAGYHITTLTISIPGVASSQQFVPVVFVVH